MGMEYSPASDDFIIDPAWVFTDSLLSVPKEDVTIVLHKTANNGPANAQTIANYFHNDNAGHKSVHFVVGLQGEVVQVVHLKDGAGGNCCLEPGHDAYWDRLLQKYGNLNRCTISIEHVDETVDNSQPMTALQLGSSYQLISWLCQKYGIGPSQVKGHNSLDPIDRARCPGPTYPMTQLLQSLAQEGKPMPNEHQLKQMQDVWNAVLPGLDMSTRIGKLWQTNFLSINPGPPLCKPFQTVNWNGGAITYQQFGNGVHAEDDGTTVRWYALDNRQLA